MPNARVLAWGYNANAIALKDKSTSSNRILQHAQTLVAQLAADREALAYAESHKSYNLAHIYRIFTSTYGLIFFGTPHNGASKAHLLSFLEKMTALTVPKRFLQTDSALVRALREDSETLQNITDQFVPIMGRFRMMFLWEQERTDLKYTREYIVEETSAAPMLSGDIERSGIASDHQGMCKFVNKEDQGFRVVIAVLKRYMSDSPTAIETRHQKAEQSTKQSRFEEASELIRGL
ncbi:uncharacterized protein KY384_007135 [Bacidia gigantensis]|uniref:uncharacterized protein n=1 Tax=Bacidia gigantensis TaxID=2732470 RepID=UPI001D0467FF|nr:uncharacterized protein KY384_007135 [Bacidia gigantensis]KAG8528218.1 hypothetical protein KY384_007135 [Bacidia gigantensis]